MAGSPIHDRLKLKRFRRYNGPSITRQKRGRMRPLLLAARPKAHAFGRPYMLLLYGAKAISFLFSLTRIRRRVMSPLTAQPSNGFILFGSIINPYPTGPSQEARFQDGPVRRPQRWKRERACVEGMGLECAMREGSATDRARDAREARLRARFGLCVGKGAMGGRWRLSRWKAGVPRSVGRAGASDAHLRKRVGPCVWRADVRRCASESWALLNRFRPAVLNRRQ